MNPDVHSEHTRANIPALRITFWAAHTQLVCMYTSGSKRFSTLSDT